MEDGLVLKKMWQRKQNAGLNPCCSGRCSSTVERPGFYHPGKHDVLILVVVEDVLVPVSLPDSVELTTRLNPCCGGRCSSTPHVYT